MARAVLKEQKRAATAEHLSGRSVPQDWAADARRAADARLREMGLPQARDEYWKYTRPADLVCADPVPAAPMPEGEAPMFDGVAPLRAVFVDGVFDADASDDLALDGVQIQRLTCADANPAQSLYGVLEAAGQDPVERPMAAYNTAYATDGLVIHVTGKPARPIEITYRHVSDRSDAVLHHVVRVDPGAEVTILEQGSGAARMNTCLEIDVADEARFHHVRVQGRDHDRRVASHVFGRLGRESVFKSFTLTVNGVLTRNEAVLTLTGDDAVAHVAGACLGDGGDFHHDDTVFITHDAVNCESRQVFKKVLRNGATGVFQGKILVKDGAQKTDGYQISQSLLLDDDAQFLAKPELEIYADDVACSHGSTSGAIDEEGLFYLRSRGVPEREATDLLTLAFLAEALDEIDSDDLSEALLDKLSLWLGQR